MPIGDIQTELSMEPIQGLFKFFQGESFLSLGKRLHLFPDESLLFLKNQDILTNSFNTLMDQLLNLRYFFQHTSLDPSFEETCQLTLFLKKAAEKTSDGIFSCFLMRD